MSPAGQRSPPCAQPAQLGHGAGDYLRCEQPHSALGRVPMGRNSSHLAVTGTRLSIHRPGSLGRRRSYGCTWRWGEFLAIRPRFVAGYWIVARPGMGCRGRTENNRWTSQRLLVYRRRSTRNRLNHRSRLPGSGRRWCHHRLGSRGWLLWCCSRLRSGDQVRLLCPGVLVDRVSLRHQWFDRRGPKHPSGGGC